MKTESLPETVQAILAQAGGLGLSGAFTYVGASAFSYRCLPAEALAKAGAESHGEYRSSRPSRLTPEGGLGFIEAVYDRVIRGHNAGFIPLS